jgi:hypothetical protein
MFVTVGLEVNAMSTTGHCQPSLIECGNIGWAPRALAIAIRKGLKANFRAATAFILEQLL